MRSHRPLSRIPQLPWRLLGLLTAAAGLVLPVASATAGGPSGGAPAAATGWRTVAYGSVTLRVPASWPVYDLTKDPARCVRFDVHAVYLGHEGPAPNCPARLLGRTEAVQLEGLDAQAVAQLVRPVSATVAGQTAEVSRSAAGGSIVAALPRSGLLVTVSYGSDPAVANTVFGSLQPLTGAAARVPHPMPAPRVVAAAPPAALAAAAAARPTVAGPAAPAAPAVAGSSPQTFSGLGFDTCTAPSESDMWAWRYSPYRAVGVYIAGAVRACSQPNLTAAWVSLVQAWGWRLLPLDVGLQAPAACQSGLTPMSPDPGTAYSQGVATAQDAAANAQSLGIGPGSTIYDDMENYDNEVPGCTQAVLSFLSGWTQALHAAGYSAGAYGSDSSLITDFVANYGNPSYRLPDDVWFAKWDGNANTYDSTIPASEWANNQRVHQYAGGSYASYDGVGLDVDGDAVDATIVGLPSTSSSDLRKYGVVDRPWGQHLLQRDPFTGALDVRALTSAGWTSWASLGGELASAPAVAWNADTGIAVAVEGLDGQAYFITPYGSDTSWRSLGGQLTGPPAIVSWGPGRFDVFAPGTDGQLWHTWSTDGGVTWTSAWQPLGGRFSPGTGPAATSPGPDEIDVFVHGTNNGLWGLFWNGSSWSSYLNMAGDVVGDPAASSMGPGQAEVFVRGTTNQLYHKWVEGAGWSSWTALGGVLASSPGASAVSGTEATSVAVLGITGLTYERVLQWPSWDAWTALP